jgi:hypothetical protein
MDSFFITHYFLPSPISKSNVRDIPVFGSLCIALQTIFVERESSKEGPYSRQKVRASVRAKRACERSGRASEAGVRAKWACERSGRAKRACARSEQKEAVLLRQKQARATKECPSWRKRAES